MYKVKRINVNSKTAIARFIPINFNNELSEVEKLADTIGVSGKVSSYFVTKSDDTPFIDVVFKL